MACRNPEKTLAAIEELSAATGKVPIALDVDFSSLDSVEKAAKEFRRCFTCFLTRLTVLKRSY
jgi:hypothetical protein